jgi:hypothetical protein
MWCAAYQQIPRRLWSSKGHYPVHKDHPLNPILRRMRPVHSLSLMPILILSSDLDIIVRVTDSTLHKYKKSLRVKNRSREKVKLGSQFSARTEDVSLPQNDCV